MRSLVLLALLGLLGLVATLLAACETETATTAVVDNAYPHDPTGSTTVYKVWWRTTLFADPVAAGASSEELRTVPATDTAYAVLAPGWDPTSSSPPARVVLARSRVPLTVVRGQTLHVVVSDQTFLGDCRTTGRLSQEEADFIATRIFPGELAGRAYDAETCVTAGEPGDGGGADAADGAGDAADAGAD